MTRIKYTITLTFLVTLVLTGLGWTVCPYKGDYNLSVPAVIGDSGGGVVPIEIRITDGNGDVYTNIQPPVGLSTQLSIIDALTAAKKVAFHRTNKTAGYDDCNYFISIEGNTRYVNGPSAGLAFALKFTSIFTHQPLNDNVIYTGTIDENGQIGAVGGVLEKGRAAILNNKTVLLTKLTGFKDYILSYYLMDHYGIKIINVNNLSDAFELASSPGLNETWLEERIESDLPVSPTKVIDDEFNDKDPRFQEITYRMIDRFSEEAEESLDGYEQGSFNRMVILRMLDDMDNQRELNERGYSYTAANNVFNYWLNLRFMNRLNTNIDLDKEKSKVLDCVNRTSHIEKTYDNWEWVTGGEVRINWAKNSAGKIDPETYQHDIQEAKFDPLYTLLSAEGWCELSETMMFEGKGEPIDERKLKDYTSQVGVDVQRYILKSPEKAMDALEHLSMAEDEKERGEYLTALYDYAFAYGIQKSYTDTFDKSSIEIKDMLSGIEDKRYDHVWPRAYHSQAVYLYRIGDYSSSYRVESIASKLEEVFDHAEEILKTEYNEGSEASSEPETEVGVSCQSLLAVVVLLLIAVISVMITVIFNTKRV